MKDVRIKKTELQEIVRKNRNEHRDLFVLAQKAYRKKVIDVLDAELTEARNGRVFNMVRITQLTAPEDHTADYDRVLRMLDMECERIVTLTQREFSQLVDDDWDWGQSWALSNSQYVSSPKMDKYLH